MKILVSLTRKKVFFMNTELNRIKWLEKVENTMKIGGKSKRTLANYNSHINRFFDNFASNINIKNLDEEEITEFFLNNYIKLNLSASSLNVGIYSVRYLYSVCFRRKLNKQLLPTSKVIKRIPTIISKCDFLKIFNEEKSIKYKCWLMLAFGSGLRVEEVATLKIENIFSKDNKLKVVGKGKKERFTILPDVTICFLRLYCKKYKITNKQGYLFKGTKNKEHMNCKTIINYFTQKKKDYNLADNITFHSLRHAFATYFLMNGGDIYALKSMLGHSTLASTSIYIHIAHDFNNLRGINYV